jgi:hypothetical protein
VVALGQAAQCVALLRQVAMRALPHGLAAAPASSARPDCARKLFPSGLRRRPATVLFSAASSGCRARSVDPSSPEPGRGPVVPPPRAPSPQAPCPCSAACRRQSRLLGEAHLARARDSVCCSLSGRHPIAVAFDVSWGLGRAKPEQQTGRALGLSHDESNSWSDALPTSVEQKQPATTTGCGRAR